MNWVEVISIILGSGGLGTLITSLVMAKYKRKAAELENNAQAIKNHSEELKRWEELHNRALQNCDEVKAQYTDLIKRKDERLISRDKEITDLKSELAQKDKKIESLYDQHSKDREIIDALRSENTALAIFRCDKVDCNERQPPFAYQIPALALTETLKTKSNG